MSWRQAGAAIRHAAVRSGMVLFIVAAAQSLAYVLTLAAVAACDRGVAGEPVGRAWGLAVPAAVDR